MWCLQDETIKCDEETLRSRNFQALSERLGSKWEVISLGTEGNGMH